MSLYRILLADDHALVREGIKSIIARDPDLHLIGEVGDGLELLEFLKTSEPDLIILDISMPYLDGLEALKQIKATYPKIKILILTMHKSKAQLLTAFLYAADGYLLKGDAFDNLFVAIKKIRQGGHYISGLMSDQLVNWIRSDNPSRNLSEPHLGPKELSVLTLIARGKSMKQIAEELAIALPSVHYHCNKLRKKFNVSTNAGLITYALEKKYISI